MVTLRHSLLILLLAILCLLTISQQHGEEDSVADGFIEGSASYPNNPDDEDSDSVEASAIPPADLKPAIPPENIEEKLTSPANKIVVPVTDDTTAAVEKNDQSTGVSILGISSTPSGLPTDSQILSMINILIIASIIVVIIVIAVSCYACRSSEKDGYTRGNKVGETI
uniref:Syndecan domain-containing protein n=1 Tax=Strongyloides venezuelensis TaxID=75913 RepID=A0A0K0EWT0_STRVS